MHRVINTYTHEQGMVRKCQGHGTILAHGMAMAWQGMAKGMAQSWQTAIAQTNQTLQNKDIANANDNLNTHLGNAAA